MKLLFLTILVAALPARSSRIFMHPPIGQASRIKCVPRQTPLKKPHPEPIIIWIASPGYPVPVVVWR